MSGFDLIDLQLLVNVVDTLSLTRGAERSHLSAPAASARIRKMEETFGTRLFHRSAQGLVPTARGDAVLRHALVILRHASQLTGELRGDAGQMQGTVRLYANTLAVSEFIPPALQSFLLAHPAINIDLHERPSADIAKALKQGTAQVGILSSDVVDEGLQYLPYRTDRLVLATPEGHPLARHDRIEFGQALGFDFIGLRETMPMQSFMARAAAREGFAMKTRIQVGNFQALCGLVEAGIGVAIIPASVARRHAQALRIVRVELAEPWARRDLKIAVRREEALPETVRALIAALQEDDPREAPAVAPGGPGALAPA